MTIRNETLCCGLRVIDLNNGNIVHALPIYRMVEQIHGLMSLPQVFRLMALGTKTDEICQILMIGEQ